MFSPPKLTTIATALTGLMALTTFAQAQDADYQRRLAAMQQARERATSASTNQSNQPMQMRVAANPGYEYAAPPAPRPQQRVAQGTFNAPANRSSSGVRTASASASFPQSKQPVATAATRQSSPQNRVAPNNAAGRPAVSNGRYTPGHVRTAQLYEGAVIEGGSPVVGNGTYETVFDAGYVDDGYYSEDGGAACGDCGGYFECGDECCGRGGCPEGPCWLSGLGLILYNGDYFAGAQGFQNPAFSTAGTGNQLVGDCNFGFYGGVNYGIPLCRLSCGLLSGQLGVRTVQSNFDGNQFSAENRDQTFLTTGLYRRVDYGLQGGVVVDYLFEDWFTRTETAQIRTDLGWVWPGGTTFGFRYAANVQDDVQPATINNNTIQNLTTTSQDNYRFYLRHDACAGGYGEVFFGWTDAEQTIFGMETDLPITDTIAAEATFTYYLDDTVAAAGSGFQGGHPNDAWNVGVGFAWRPQGRSYYRSYDRPLFDVADNGSMLINRR